MVQALLPALRAIAEPTRLRILWLCAHGELSVSELVQILGQSQPRISRHLKLLSEAGLLERFREGSWVFHRIAREGLGADVAGQLLGLIDEGDPDIEMDTTRLAAVKSERAKSAADYFRRNAADWDRIRSMHVDDQDVEAALCALFPPDGVNNLLDIGTGTGRMLELFADRIESGHGIDLSRDMLAVARANLENAGVQHCSVRHGDLYQLPYPPHSFDAVTIHQVLHFMDEPGRALAEAVRVLRPGGILLLVDFAPHDREEFRTEYSHRRLGFSESEVAIWFEATGLKLQETRHLPGASLTVSIWCGNLPKEIPADTQSSADDNKRLLDA
ncbi:MAG: ArsR/SmtB family transcription factor [Rhodospirillales bacterium]|jgi:ArsR family transcriptional regulator